MAKKTESADGNILADVALEATVTKNTEAELEALRARVAELECQVPKEPDPDDPEALVDYTAPLTGDPQRDKPVFVSVNGENIRIKRGVPVKIKRKFLEVLEHAREQEYAAYKAQNDAQRRSDQAITQM